MVTVLFNAILLNHQISQEKLTFLFKSIIPFIKAGIPKQSDVTKIIKR